MDYGSRTFYKSGQWNVNCCNTCNIEKPETEFYKHSNGKLRRQCISCVKAARTPICPEKRKAITNRYRENNYDKCLQNFTKWRKANLEYDRYRAAFRRLLVKQQTPQWADKSKIKEVYLSCPPNYHVDHIVPLKGDNVCGLHVEYNLQYLTPKENLSKRNKYA